MSEIGICAESHLTKIEPEHSTTGTRQIQNRKNRVNRRYYAYTAAKYALIVKILLHQFIPHHYTLLYITLYLLHIPLNIRIISQIATIFIMLQMIESNSMSHFKYGVAFHELIIRTRWQSHALPIVNVPDLTFRLQNMGLRVPIPIAEIRPCTIQKYGVTSVLHLSVLLTSRQISQKIKWG